MQPDIDHVPFAVESLDEAMARFEELDIAPQYGGEHPEASTEMALIPLPDGTYIELIAPTGPDPDYWPEFLAEGAGPCAWCIRSEDVHVECQRVIEHGIQVRGPKHGSRRRPDGVLVEWDQAFIGPPEDHTFPFVVTDRTPRGYRIPDNDLQDSPISGIGWVVIAVQDLASVIERFVDLYRLPQPMRETDPVFGDLATFPGQNLFLVAPEDSELCDRLDKFGDAPSSVLLEGDISAASSQYPLRKEKDWFGRTVAFFEGFPRQLGIVNVETEASSNSGIESATR